MSEIDLRMNLWLIAGANWCLYSMQDDLRQNCCQDGMLDFIDDTARVVYKMCCATKAIRLYSEHDR